MGLPYLLGDKNPKDPVNGWDKTWAYLKELNGCIEYYPTGTGAVMKELGEGSLVGRLLGAGARIGRVGGDRVWALHLCAGAAGARRTLGWAHRRRCAWSSTGERIGCSLDDGGGGPDAPTSLDAGAVRLDTVDRSCGASNF